MNISGAIELIQHDRYAARSSWPNLTYIYLRGPDIMYAALGIDSVWVPAHSDLLNTDWVEVTPER